MTTSTSGWQSTPGATSTTNKYLWNYEKITYTDSSTKNSECRVIGTHGATGGTGAAGRSLVSSVQQFYLSTSNTTQSGGSWVTTCPTWQPGKFLWKRWCLPTQIHLVLLRQFLNVIQAGLRWMRFKLEVETY